MYRKPKKRRLDRRKERGDPGVEAFASRLYALNRKEQAWFLRGVIDAISGDDHVQGGCEAGPYLLHYVHGYESATTASA